MSNFKPIYVAGAGTTHIALNSGASVLAIRPASKDEKHSYIITSKGKFSRLAGQRMHGIGVEKYVQQCGYTVAASDDASRLRLADMIAVDQGRDLVQDASRFHGNLLHQKFGGSECLYVPFDPAKPVEKAKVSEYTGSSLMMIDFSGFSGGSVNVDPVWDDDSYRRSSMNLIEGWVVPTDTDLATVPRATEFGGPVEEAAFIIANSGLATVSGPMADMWSQLDDETFPRGKMTLAVTGSTDLIHLGADGTDTLLVQYIRNGNVLFSRNGMEQLGDQLSRGSVIGSIAAVLYLAREVDAAAQIAVQHRKKAA